MKKNTVLFYLIFLSLTIMSAQEIELCGTPYDSTPDPPGVYSYGTSLSDSRSTEKHVFNIFFVGVNRDDGTSDDPLTEEKALEAIANINKAFNQFNMFFKYRGFVNMNNSDFYVTDGGQYHELVAYAQNNGFYNFEAYNVMVPKDFIGFGGIAPGVFSTHLGVDADKMGGTLIHELGHKFRLSHTHAGYNTHFDSNPTNDSNCEHVERDIDHPDFNATTAGDRVVDTAAAPRFYRQDQDGNTIEDINVNNCTYIADAATYAIDKEDCLGTPYNLSSEDAQNYMSYTFDECRTYFSPGQGVRMREFIAEDIDENPDGSSIIGTTSTTIASLYEPYKGEYYFAGPPIPDEDQPHFQPGFDYHFVSCSGYSIDPTDYDDTTFPYDSTISYDFDKDYLGAIIHRNHYAIVIDQLDPSQPHNCQDNNNRLPPPIDIRVIRFNDNVLNRNITEMEMHTESFNIDSPLEHFEKGLYQVEVLYDDGSKKQTIINKSW